MHSSDLDSIIPAGKVFFPAGIRSFSDHENFAPALNFMGRSGVVLIGLGQTGDDVLRMFFNRLPQYQREGGSIVRAISIMTRDDRKREIVEPNIEYFSLGAAESTERIQVNTDQRRNVLRNINKYLEDQLLDYQHNFGTGSDIRCFFVASLSESETGLLSPILEVLANKRSFLADRAMFLLFNSPYTPALDQQYQYSTIREISHYLQTGVHVPDSHASDKLLDRIYSFEGSRNKSDYQKQVLAVTETLLTFLTGGTGLRRFETGVKSIEGNHNIRAIGIRSLTVPILELRDYFASTWMQEMWLQDKTLFPANKPSNEDVNIRFRAFHNDRSYYQYLVEWLGDDVARWLLNQGSLPPVINEAEFSLEFLQKMVNFLSNVQQQERYLIAWAGLWFVEGRTASFPILQDACRQLGNGLEKLFESIGDYQKSLDDLAQKGRQSLDQTASGSVSRWNVRNLDERVEQIHERLLDKSQKERFFEQIKHRSGLSAKYVNTIIFSPVFVSFPVQREFVISDFIWHDHADYFKKLYETISGFVMSLLLESAENIHELDNNAFLYLSEMEQSSAILESPVLSENKLGFLVSSNELNVDAIKKQSFKFSSNFVHVPQPHNKTVTALTLFTGLRMDDFKYIKQCAEVYTPDENTHMDQHLKNAAYFEKQLRRSNSLRARDLFCEQVIMTLLDRNTPTAFFKAFLAGILKWDAQNMSWHMDSVKIKKYDYLDLDLGNNQSNNLAQSIQKENIRSLWEAYRRFAVDIPYRELSEGAFQHPLHANNRAQYLESVISYCKLDGSEEQGNRKKWLEKQAEDRRDHVELHDFYRLFQAVMKSQ